MKKIAFINQRYGLDVVGGSEYYTRILAEKLTAFYRVEVLTTTSVDHMTWDDTFMAGVETLNGVTIRRFRTERPRDIKEMGKLTPYLLDGFGADENSEHKWIDAQGPFCPALISYIQEHQNDYDVFLVVTYTYYPAVYALPLVAGKAIFIPTAHDEPWLHFNTFKRLFRMPKAFVFLTEEERTLVQKLFQINHIRNEVIGIGIDHPANYSGDAFKLKYGLEAYIYYVGRIEQGKGLDMLFDDFIRYKKTTHNNLKLVLHGKANMKIPKCQDILYLGFASEEEKFSAMQGALALINPSAFESLSIILLEAMSVSTPVIVNAKSEVLKAHCLKSNAGLYYMDYPEFEGILNYMLLHPQTVELMRHNAFTYYENNYCWASVLDRLCNLIEYAAQSGV